MTLHSMFALLSLTLVNAPPSAPPGSLIIRAGQHAGKAADVLDPAAAAWQKAAPTRILLNRTPRIYQTEPTNPPTPPPLEVRCLHAENSVVLRLVWDDATMDAPEAPPKKTGEGGDPAQLYKRPTGETAAFADAAAVMVPDEWNGKGFPSLVMGDRNSPARIYYWNASRGAKLLSATGRATQTPTGKSFEHRARHADGKWSVTLELPTPPQGSPVAFAIWDGHNNDRDGLKFFSLWYAFKAD